NTPDYKKIYEDILNIKYPEKKEICQGILNKTTLSTFDVIALNRKIFGEKNLNIKSLNQKYRSYSILDRKEILDYQKKHNLNNNELANHFKLSRNTIAKWKKMFL
ncbi:helix-turn-helix domain-containing protein, partial [Empedobacter brevis]